MSAQKPPALVSIPAGTPARTCSGCGATIYGVITAKGAKAPVHINSELAPKSAAPTDLLDGQGINHFADCPAASQFHKRGKA